MLAVTPDPLSAQLARLAQGLLGLDMRAAAQFAPDLIDERDRIVRTIEGYLIPRLTDPGRPMTVVIAGPTGSGKSTILNSLAGLDLAETGALRPTTRTPLVATTAGQAPRLGHLGGVRCHVTTARTPILSRMALVDTPDIDSTSIEHREMTERLIDSADAVVFVTSPLRYADRVPWDVLRRAVGRGAPLILVLNRATPSSAGAIGDYKARLDRAGIEADIVRVPEHRAGPAATRVPGTAVRALAGRLFRLAENLDGGRLSGMAVAARVLDDASRLGESLDGLARLVDRHRTQIEELVAQGRSQLSLGGSLKEIRLPIRGGRIRRLLRLPARPVTENELGHWLGEVSARVSSVAESQIRATAMELEALLPIAPRQVIVEPALVTLATAIHGWLAHVRRVTEGMGRRSRHLGTAILVLQALGPGDDGLAQRALGGRHHTLSEGARADLEARLSVAFSQLAVVALARLEAGAGVVCATKIEELVTRVNARLAFADA
jgi:energy-coupling factor transporter ATP-binding protein EcfA2